MVFGAIKGIYSSLEDKWYGFWDKLDEHLPVYGVIDAVDNVVPSFMLFLILVILLVMFGAYFFLSPGKDYSAEFTIKSNDGKVVTDTLIFAKLKEGGNVIKELNERTNNQGKINYKGLKNGQEIKFDINISKGVFYESFTVDSDLEETIKLAAPPIVLKPVDKKIFVKNSSGFNPTENIELFFSCENSNFVPTPSSATYDGTKPVQVTEPVDCRLQATVNHSKYKQKTYSINSTMYDLFLENFEQPTTSLKVLVRANGYPISDSSFKISLTGKNTYEGDTQLASEATINVQPGTYFLSVSDKKGNYGIRTLNVDVNSPTEIVVAMEKTIKSRVKIILVDETTGALIPDGIVTAKDTFGREVAFDKTNSLGYVQFSFTDLGTYIFAGKKIGDLNGGYFPKELTQQLTGDMNATLRLTKVTTQNAGKVKVKVTDQDGIAVINAKVMLKYKENDGIVELYAEKNYVYTDLNGEANIIAGKVEGSVYAYAIKGPFFGASLEKLIAIDKENLLAVQMQVGSATVKINAINEAGDLVDATAEILTVDGKMIDDHGLAGIILVEKGKATRTIKAGQTIYIKLKASDEGYEDYFTAPVMLWPNKTYNFNVTMLKQISEPGIKYDNKVYNESDAPVQQMAPGKKYYAKFLVNSDKQYNQVMFNFRAGKEALLENDIIEIDSVEAANITSETRGTTYDPTKGYAFDSEHTTDGLAKWSNTFWNNFGRGTREVKVNFRIKKTAGQNKEIQFFYKAKFDDTRVPPSNAQQDFYADTYSSNVYFVGTEAECVEGFCASSEWLYSKSDELYIDSPYSLKQVTDYTYHLTLLNNSEIDYGKSEKKIYLNINVVGDEGEDKRVKIKNYKIKDSLGEINNQNEIFSVNNIELNTFAKNATADITMDIEGLKEGADIIKFELKSEGRIIYTKDVSFAIISQKDFTVSVSPQFVPALMNTQLEVVVLDEKGNYLPDVSVKSFAKETGFEQYLVDSDETNRLGKAIVDSGALFQQTKVILELAKEGYARKTLSLTVSSEAIASSPDQLLVELNTYSKREEIKEITFANFTQQNLQLKSISLDAKFDDVINEDAMNAYFEELTNEDRLIKAEDTLDVKLLRIRLANSITQENFIEPIMIEGDLKATFENKALHILYDVTIPLTLNVSSQAEAGEDCLILKPTTKTTATTEKAMARFSFELINACASDGVNLPLEALSVTSSSEIPGIAEVSVVSSTGLGGRTALDGGNRIIIAKIPENAKMFGTLTFAPGEDAIGKTVTIPISFEAKFQGQSVRSNPSALNFVTNVINLKECMSINSDSAPIGFKEKAKITIDTSACLGQKIDVILCKGDSGCSGGVEGKITLSKKSFTLQNKSQEVDAYGPSLPGTYGVTVHARARGSTGFTYIGEVPVSFTEPEGKFFALNKTELMLVGAGSQDAVILTNKALTQEVRVKANGCVWGEEEPDMDWMQVMGGAMLGATLGNMIGQGFQTRPREGENTAADREAAQNNLTGEQVAIERNVRNDLTTGANSMVSSADATQTGLEGSVGAIDSISGNMGSRATGLSSMESSLTPEVVGDASIPAAGEGFVGTIQDSAGRSYTVENRSDRSQVITMYQDGTAQYSKTYNADGSTVTARFDTPVQSSVGYPPATLTTASNGTVTYSETGGNGFVRNNAGTTYNVTTGGQQYTYNNSGTTRTYSQGANSMSITGNSTIVTTPTVTKTIQTTNGVTNTSYSGRTTLNGTINHSIPVTITQTRVTDASGVNAQTRYTVQTTSTGRDYSYGSQQAFQNNAGRDITSRVYNSDGSVDYGYRLSSNWFVRQSSRPSSNYSSGSQTTVNPMPLNTGASGWRSATNSPLDASIKIAKASFSALHFPALNPAPVKSDGNKISFTLWAGHQQGWFTLIGAIAGGVLAYMSQEFDCADEQYDQIVSYTDFVILLQGENITVTNPAGTTTTEREIPSDAGALGFSLDGISAAWNFEDADYSDVENVGITFSNGGLNDPMPRYGTLTIGATVHKHGTLTGLLGTSTTTTTTSSSTTTDYDVLCTEPTFGNYWIGDTDEDGKCSSISTSDYSQKYHMRVISGEPAGEEAFIRKATSCYSGALTGSTGKQALPKVLLDWDWDSISQDTCDYTNPEYVYCDASQFMIALTKKLAALDEFMVANGEKFSCPPDMIEETVQSSMDEINSQTTSVPTGFIGISEMSVNTIDDETTVTVTVQNKSGAAQETFLSYSLKSVGQPDQDQEVFTAPVGEYEIEFTFDTPQSDDLYYFTAIVNGEKGDRTPVTRVFINRDAPSDCWVQQTTRPMAGIPGLLYYTAGIDQVTYTDRIRDDVDLYNTINFGVYLTKDAYTEDFFSDFKQYYRETLLQKVNVDATQRAIVDYITSGNFKIKKKFSGDNVVEAGLYDVWVKLDAPSAFRVVDGNSTKLSVELLLVKKPSVDSPFYSMPFDGVLGQTGGRQGYGSTYKNAVNSENLITISNFGTKVTAFESGASNGITTITTNTKTSFDAMNASALTRGQLGSAIVSGASAELVLTPNYATPIIARHSMEGTSGEMSFALENTKKAVPIGGNLSYWTGAAKSKDFYGGNAIDLFNNSPDYKLTNLGDNIYGFTFDDTTRAGSMYLKSVFFVPQDESRYNLVANSNGTSFWTTSSDFATNVELLGIPGMKYNNLQNGSYIKSLQDLFDAVAEGKVCVSSDGASSSFWWNPTVIENTTGSTTSQGAKELELVGSS